MAVSIFSSVHQFTPVQVLLGSIHFLKTCSANGRPKWKEDAYCLATLVHAKNRCSQELSIRIYPWES